MLRRAPARGRGAVRLLARPLAHAFLATSLAAGSALHAQDPAVPAPPAHEPLNPAIVARSGLLHLPLEAPAPRWTFSSTAEYGSVVERNLTWPDLYLYDAELLRVQVAARRDVGERGFVRLQAGVTGAYDGFADAFCEDYPQLIQWVMPERDTRPRNAYGARLLLTERAIDVESERHALLPADLRATIGMRLGGAHQTAVSLTVPVAPARSVFARRVPSVSAMHTARASGRAFTVEGSVGVGYTPRTGELSNVQRTVFTMAAAGASVALARDHSLYATLFHHGAAYRGTNFPELDGTELSADFGYAWRSRSGRVWRIGLTEDLRRRDPGIDLVVKVGVE